MCGSGDTAPHSSGSTWPGRMITHVCLFPFRSCRRRRRSWCSHSACSSEGRVPCQSRLDPGWQVVSVIPQSPRHPSQSLLPWVGADTLHRAPEYSRGQTWLAARHHAAHKNDFSVSSDAGAGDPKRSISSHGNDRKSIFQCPEIKLYWHMATPLWPLTQHGQG